MLGRDLIALCHGTLEAFLSDLLARETDPGGSLLLAEQMTKGEEGLRILISVQRGFESRRGIGT
jgi:hypothetical protein